MIKKLFLALIILFLPIFVCAIQCNTGDVSITSLEEVTKHGVVLVDEATFHNKNIGLNLRFYQLGDSIEYIFNVQNDSREDFEIDENSFNIDTRYISYKIITEDNSMLVKAGQSKNFVLTATYQNEVPSEAFSDATFSSSDSIQFNLSNNSDIDNPKTGSIPTMILIAFILSLILIISLTRMKSTMSHYLFLVLLCIVLLPFTVYAICSLKIEVSTTYTISKNPLFCIQYDEDEQRYYEFEKNMTFEQFINSSYNDHVLKLNNVSTATTRGYVVPYDSEFHSFCHSLFYTLQNGERDALSTYSVSKFETIHEYKDEFCYQYVYNSICEEIPATE